MRRFAVTNQIWIVAVVMIITACVGTQYCSAANIQPVKSLLELRRNNVVIQKWDLSCGAAALATILAYEYGDPIPEKDIAKALMSRKEYIENPEFLKIRQGFSLLDLKRYVDGRGYQGIGFGKLTFADLIEKAPIMVPVNFFGYNHFVIFLGLMEDRVLLADPGWGNRTMVRGKFEDAWIDYGEAMGKVGFVVEQHGTVPPNQLRPKASDFVMLR